MEAKELLDLFQDHPVVQKIANRLRKQTEDKDKVGERDRFARGFYCGRCGTGNEGITAFRVERQGGGSLFLQ